MMASVNAVEFATPHSQSYAMRVGTWVTFNKGGDPTEPRRRRVVYVMDTCATVRDEHTREEVCL